MRTLPALLLLACNDFSVGNIGDNVPPGACPLDIPPAGIIPTDPQCGAVPEVADPWSMRTEWTWAGAGDAHEERSSYSPPLVARIHDSNEDGVLDEQDHPNIVVIAFSADWSTTREGSIAVIDGVTHETVMEASGVYYGTGHAVGDVDGDGWPDLIVFDAGRRVIALDRFGNMLWRTVPSVDSLYPQATLADLDGDGVAEVIADNLVLDGPTGAVKAELVTRSGIPYTAPIVGDIDLDGNQEIVYGNTVHDFDGTPLWNTNIQGDYGHFSTIFQADDDLEGEVLMLGASRMMVFDTWGETLYINELPRRAGSPPCMGDFDGDGQSEIAFALTNGNSLEPTLFRAYDIDGTLLWSKEVNDASGIAGCSGYDFDGDGVLEILYADETELYVFAGATGDVRYVDSDHASGTVYEYPVVADVDMDGSAEVLSVRSGNDDFDLLRVVGHDGPGWAPASAVWPIHDFAVSNMTPEATVPDAPSLYWVEHNTFRARPVIDARAVDWQVSMPDVCVAGCSDEAPVRIAVQVHNQGPYPLPVETPLTLWWTDGETERPVRTQWLEPALPGRVYNVVFEESWAELKGGTIYVRVDDVGTGAGIWAECSEDNNVAMWADLSCE